MGCYGSKFLFAKKALETMQQVSHSSTPNMHQQSFLLELIEEAFGSDNTQNKCLDSGARFKLEALDNDAGFITSPHVPGRLLADMGCGGGE